MTKNTLHFILLLIIPIQIFAQRQTQTVSGIIRDKQTKVPLIGASVVVVNSNPQNGTTSDENGNFILKNVSTGRHSFKVQYIGYESFITDEIIVSSTKEPFVEISLTASAIMTDEVVISANKNAFEPLNSMSVVSTRSFTQEETERMPAGVNDPGRVALSYPGVQRGPDDSENQIVVRGNSPIGILWRLEGIDIPNPNHFAVVGSSGGGITVFSAQLLAKSDFSTGGFAAEYGNALSGAFDMNFRSGNLQKREERAKIGILGLDFATEGPIKKGFSSYLVNYRYSTLGLLSRMGFYLVGERVINDFQDLSFNLTFRSKNKKAISTVFGIGGLSLENYLPVTNPAERKVGVANNWENRYKPSNVGALGYTYTFNPNEKSYFKAVVALMGSEQTRLSDTLNLKDERYRYNDEHYTDTRLATSLTYSNRIRPKTLFKTGVIFNQIFFNFSKETKPRQNLNDINQREVKVSVNGSGQTQTIQQYAQILQNLTDKLSLNVGYHFLHLTANNTSSLEPRISMQYSPTTNQKISFAYGLHGRILPLMTYFYVNETGQNTNKSLKMLKANHYILAYHLFTKNRMRIIAEVYRQDLMNVPISTDVKSRYWMLNFSSDFPEFPLVSKGKGRNQGIDLAIEKQFSNSYFFLVTGSFLKSTFEVLDGKTYNSRFNTGFSSSYTIGKEFAFKNGGILQIGGRFLLNGGFRYTPFDPILSRTSGKYVAKEFAEYEGQVPAYRRLDTRVAYRFNKRKLSGNISLDFQNVLNYLNPTSIGYNAAKNETFFVYNGSGFIPVLTTQFDF